MRHILALILTTASVATAAEIPAGTHLLLRMEHSVSSRTAKVGDGVHLRTVVPVSAEGRIVVPAGSFAQGVISEVKRGKHSELRIQLMTLMLPGGEVLQVAPKTSSAETIAGRTSNAIPVYPGAGPLGLAVAGAIAGGQIGARAGLGVGAAMVLISALAGHRQDVELRQGSAVDVVFDQPTVIERATQS